MDKIAKFLRKLPPKLRQQLIDVISQLSRGDTNGLDIVAMQGQKDWYRCRVGGVRIIYLKTADGTLVIYDIGFRGDVYK